MSRLLSHMKSKISSKISSVKARTAQDDEDDVAVQDEKEEKKTDEEQEEQEEGSLRTIIDALSALVCSPLLADVWFLVKSKDGKSERIPGHRLVLASNNDVMRSLLYPIEFDKDNVASFNTKPNKGDEKDIEIADTTPEAFKMMLTCIYTDKVEVDQGDLNILIDLAKRFQVEALRIACVEFMEGDITADSACKRFEEGRKLLNDASFGLKYIEENAQDVFASEDFLNLTRESLTVLLKSNSLCIEEADLFEAVIRWAEAECKRQDKKVTADNKREVLGDLVTLVRFPQLTMQEVVTKVQFSQMLTQEDLLALFTYIGADKDSKPKIRFPTKAREGGVVFKDCTIIPNNLQRALAKMVDKEKTTRWRRVYSVKRDGDQATQFHAKCDNVGPTLTIIKPKGNKHVFGGYTEQEWSGSSSKYDPKAFLFSLVNNKNRHYKLNSTGSNYAIHCSNSYGPTFGGGHNIYVCSACSTTNSSYTNPYNSYTMTGDDGTTIDNTFLAGSYNFTVEDLEVFALVKK